MQKKILFFAVFKKEKIDGGFPNSLPSLPSDSPKDGKKILHLTRFTMLRKRA
jgi:hypothetical protein